MFLLFLSLFCHVYILTSLLQPTETLNITLYITRQLQDEVDLYQTKMAVASSVADQEYLQGNTLKGSFRFIRNDIGSTIQTALHVFALMVRGFILVSILLIQTLVDGFKFYRYHLSSSSKGRGKIIKYRPNQPQQQQEFSFNVNDKDRSILTFISTTTTTVFGINDKENEGSSGSGIISELDYLPWFKILFPSCKSTTNSEEASSEANSTEESPIMTFSNENDDDFNPMNETLSSSSRSSKDSLSTIATTSKAKRLFSIKRTKSVPVILSPPSRPLAIYNSRPFTTSNTMIVSSSQMPSHHSLIGSTLSLKLKQPGRRLSQLFRRSKNKNKK